ncbi:MAG TPA: 4-alpha-glucanotransferase [Polyangia bacterium]|nr:4-alpha-glucanotransferase [Polyangia bacterium]
MTTARAATGAGTDLFGIAESYHDARGTLHATPPATRAAILAAMGVSRAEPAVPIAPAPPPVRVVGPGDARTVDGGATLTLEDGTRLRVAAGAELPPDLPFGYHRLHVDADAEGAETLLLVTPGRCFWPAELRTWGWAAQLYAARSQGSWGIGDLADLRDLGRWSRQALGAGVVMVNPLCAPVPLTPIEPSPYYPSSRRYRNPLYLRIEEIPGAGDLGPALAAAASAGRALNARRRIDRDAVFALKTPLLEALFDRFQGDEAFDRYWNGEGEALTQFATYGALAERHGRDWRRWPEELRRPGGAAVTRFVTEQARRVRFHAFVQWRLDQQLAAASREIAVVHDLPIGLDVAGADAWCWQDLLAGGVSVGAPPDEFNVRGQDWGLSPFIPHRLRAAGYRPFIETIRAMLRHAGGLRIDHVMGLFRLFWIPHGSTPAAGTYVRTRADELLAIVDIESQRAGAFIIGEDLGTVEAGVREALAAHRMLSYRLLYFEPGAPAELPEMALSSVTTHDLATVAGLWSGRDVTDSLAAGLEPNEPGMRALRERLAALAGVAITAPAADAVEGAYRALAAAPSRILLATLDDAIAVAERPNMPGTTTTWPNWSLALPQTLEEIEAAALPRRLARALARTG